MTEFVHHHERMQPLLDMLRPLASQVEVRPQHWIVLPSGEEVISWHGERDWCAECAMPIVKSLRRHDRANADAYVLDGGWRRESDCPCFCAGCGCRLDVSLTFYGAIYELDHFRENPPRSGNADDACAIYEVLMGLEVTSDDHTWAADEAIEIATALRSQP